MNTRQKGPHVSKAGCILAIAALTLALGSTAALGQSDASIAGTITGDDGKPVAGVISALRTAPPAASARVQAAANGAFALANLPAGTYTICAAVDSLGYLDPCTWSVQPPTVQIADGQAATGFKLVVKKGVRLQVRLNDPDKMLGQTDSLKQGGPRVLLGVFTPRRIFVPFDLAGADADGRTHEATVPADQTVSSLYINGRGVLIVEQSGAQVSAAGKNVSIASGKGKAPAVFTFTVRDPNKY